MRIACLLILSLPGIILMVSTQEKNQGHTNLKKDFVGITIKMFTPLEIMPRCSAVPSMARFHFRMIPAGFNAPLEFLTGFTFSDNLIRVINKRISKRLINLADVLKGFYMKATELPPKWQYNYIRRMKKVIRERMKNV